MVKEENKLNGIESIVLKPAEHCPYCSSVDFVKRGVRKNKFGSAQMYLCRNSLCGRTFTARDIKGKKFPLRIIIDSKRLHRNAVSIFSGRRANVGNQK